MATGFRAGRFFILEKVSEVFIGDCGQANINYVDFRLHSAMLERAQTLRSFARKLSMFARTKGRQTSSADGGGALICQNAEDANQVMWYATQARDAYPYYQHTAIGYGSTGSPQVLTA